MHRYGRLFILIDVHDVISETKIIIMLFASLSLTT